MSIVLPDEVAVKLIATLDRLDARLALEESLQGDPVLTVADLCKRWKITERTFHRDHRDSLTRFERAKDGDLRYLLADVVRYELEHRVRADGTSIVAPDKRAARRKPGDETKLLEFARAS